MKSNFPNKKGQTTFPHLRLYSYLWKDKLLAHLPPYTVFIHSSDASAIVAYCHMESTIYDSKHLNETQT